MSTESRGRVRTEPSAKRVRAYLEGHLVADTLHPLLVWEIPYYPAYYLPLADVRAELVDTGEVDHSPSRGDGHVHDVRVATDQGELVAPGAAVTYPDSPIEALRDQVKLDWASMTSWFEEDDEVFTHPRSPYARIDILPSSRHVTVRVGDTVVADSVHAHVLHETGLPPRWYLPKADVRMDLLSPSDTVTHCPYKGSAGHLHGHVDGTTIEDIAWTYPTPLRESLQIAGLVSFYPDKVEITVDPS